LKQMEDQIAPIFFLFFFSFKNFIKVSNLRITCQKTCFSKCLRGRKGKWQSNLRE
jgi:hypothetical protein